MKKSGRWYGVYRADARQSDGTFKREQCWQPLGLVSEQSERSARKQFQPYLDKENDAAIKLAAENWSDACGICRRVADQCRGQLEGQLNAGSRITSACAHHSEVGRLPPARDHDEDCARFRCVSGRRGSLTKDGGKHLAYSLFSSQNGAVLGLCLRRFSLRRPHLAARRGKSRAAVFHG